MSVVTPHRKRSLGVVFLVVLVDLTGFGLILPLMPFFAREFGAGALEVSLLFSAYSLAQIVASPFWGGLSDRIGRKPVMILSSIGHGAAYALFAVAGSWHWLLFSRILAGFMAGNLTAAQSAVSDLTDEKSRAAGMGLIGAAFGLGFTLGPALATYLTTLSGEGSYALIGWVAAGLSAVNALAAILFLQESRPANIPTPPRRAAWQTWTHIGKASSKPFAAMFGTVAVLTLAQASLYGAFPVYCAETFGMTGKDLGILYMILGFWTVLIQGGAVRMFVRRLGEFRTFLTGLVLGAAAFIGLAISPTPGILTGFLSLMAVGLSLSGPTINSLISKTATPAETGTRMGEAMAFASLGRLLGPLWGGLWFAVFPTASFWLTGFLIAGAAILWGPQIRLASKEKQAT